MANIRNYLVGLGIGGAMLTAGLMRADSEGMVLHTYIDPVGVLTSCLGHTGPELKLDQQFTESECLNQFAEDLAIKNRQLLHLTRQVKLTEQEHAAYLSFFYWAGYGNFANSTLRKKLLAGDRQGACYELTNACHIDKDSGEKICNGWTYARNVRLAGLIKDRIKERNLCLQGAAHADMD